MEAPKSGGAGFAGAGAGMSVTSARASSRRSRRGDPPRGQGPRDRPRDDPRDRRGDVDAEPCSGGARRRLEGAPRAGRAAGGRREQRRRERRNGQRGELDALATAAEAARLLSLDVEEVLVLSTGVIGAPATARPHPRSAAAAAAALSRDGGDDAAEAILTTDTRSEAVAVSARRRLLGRRDGEGLRDDPPEPRDDARGRHDRLPARAR